MRWQKKETVMAKVLSHYTQKNDIRSDIHGFHPREHCFSKLCIHHSISPPVHPATLRTLVQIDTRAQSLGIVVDIASYFLSNIIIIIIIFIIIIIIIIIISSSSTSL
eukprot:TRINITY_DN1153_c0_g1_i5.p1 TRINITY_DN1153_c0_g1~~TRINITY_DN1153_c0_g1_i5.p1  ORF type:complete len:107 (+),score=10.16 TRINITY_DN1153_c0_g1_i5:300-620(+)